MCINPLPAALAKRVAVSTGGGDAAEADAARRISGGEARTCFLGELVKEAVDFVAADEELEESTGVYPY